MNTKSQGSTHLLQFNNTIIITAPSKADNRETMVRVTNKLCENANPIPGTEKTKTKN